MAMFQQTFWAALRSLTQIYALSIGGQFGINLITITQAINILGSGGGYELASMAYIAQLCGQEERTGMFGILMGIRMFGAAIGYICESIRSRRIISRWDQNLPSGNCWMLWVLDYGTWKLGVGKWTSDIGPSFMKGS